MGCGIILPNQYKLERGEGVREGCVVTLHCKYIYSDKWQCDGHLQPRPAGHRHQRHEQQGERREVPRGEVQQDRSQLHPTG